MIKSDHYRTATFIALLVISLLLFLLLIRPFFKPIGVAFIGSILVYPMYKWTSSVSRSRTFAASVSILTLIVLFVAPLIFITYEVYQELTELLLLLRGSYSPEYVRSLANAVNSLPGASEIIAGVSETAQRTASYFAAQAFFTIKNFLWFLVEIFVVLITIFFVLRDSSSLLARTHALSPFKKQETDTVLNKIRDTIYATVFGVVVVAMVQGFLGGVGFAILGLKSPVLWGCAMALLAMIPFLGAPVIWFPAVVYLFLHGQFMSALFLFLWGAFVVGLIDNVLRPLIIGGKARLHPLLVFFSAFGGIILLGPVGIFFGPIILSITLVLADFLEKKIKES